MYKVAVIEDQTYIANAIATMIEYKSSDFHVSGIYKDGRTFLSDVKEKGWPDIILSDIEMPFVDGLQLAKYVHERNLRIPVILLTGHKNFDYLKEGMLNEISDYLLKPCLEEDIINALEKAAKKVNQENKNLQEENAEEIKENDLINAMTIYIENNYNKDITLSDVAEKFYISYSYLSKIFTRHFGLNFSEYVIDIRIKKAKNYLQRYNLRISQISKMVGYTNYRYFNHIFKKKTGMTPTEYRKKVCLQNIGGRDKSDDNKSETLNMVDEAQLEELGIAVKGKE